MNTVLCENQLPAVRASDKSQTNCESADENPVKIKENVTQEIVKNTSDAVLTPLSSERAKSRRRPKNIGTFSSPLLKKVARREDSGGSDVEEQKLSDDLRRKEEVLRKLKMVKMYREKVLVGLFYS